MKLRCKCKIFVLRPPPVTGTHTFSVVFPYLQWKFSDYSEILKLFFPPQNSGKIIYLKMSFCSCCSVVTNFITKTILSIYTVIGGKKGKKPLKSI